MTLAVDLLPALSFGATSLVALAVYKGIRG